MEFKLKPIPVGEELVTKLIIPSKDLRQYTSLAFINPTMGFVDSNMTSTVIDDLSPIQRIKEMGNELVDESFGSSELVEKALSYTGVKIDFDSSYRQPVNIFGKKPIVSAAVLNLFSLVNYYSNGGLVTVKSFVEGFIGGIGYHIVLESNVKDVPLVTPNSHDSEKNARRMAGNYSRVLEAVLSIFYNGTFESTYLEGHGSDETKKPSKITFKLSFIGNPSN